MEPETRLDSQTPPAWGLPGVVVWMTGLPSSGKSTLAELVSERLRRAGHPSVTLDGDAVRRAMVPTPGHTPEARAAFYATLARVAALLATQGVVVLVAATAHKKAFRDEARALAPDFVEVHVSTSATECARRDTKGLYAGVRLGRTVGVPGADVEYETPAAPDVVAAGGLDADAVTRTVEAIERRLKA